MLCNYLTPKHIVSPLQGTTKEELLEGLTNVLAEINGLKNRKHLFQTILDREAEGSTFLPTGIAIPHARVPDVTNITLVMGIVPEGFKETPESDPTYIIFLFFSPIKEKEFGKHLKLLARMSAIFRDPDFVREVAALGSSDDIFALIQKKEREIVED